jgi:hypothetical protein
MAKIFKHRTDVPFFDYKDYKTLQRYVNMYYRGSAASFVYCYQARAAYRTATICCQ